MTEDNTTNSSSNSVEEARAKMIAKRFGGQAQTSTGGKGSVRRKKKVSTRSGAAQSDAKLNTTLKKLGATNIPGIEEVNFFKEDGKVVHFKNPKVQASVAANTYIVSGPSDTKPLQELLPNIASQLGMDNLQALQGMAQGMGGGGGGGVPGGMMPGMGSVPEGAEGDEDDEEEDDDDVPDLVEGNFEEVSEK